MSATNTQPVVSPFVVVQESKIHGKGLFAAVDIEPETLLGTYHGPRTQEIGDHVLWIDCDVEGEFGIDGVNELRYVNHSTEPTACFEGEELWSTGPIAQGTEITHHYGEEWA